MCSNANVCRKLAESQLTYSGGSEMPPGKSETWRVTGVRQRRAKFGGTENNTSRAVHRRKEFRIYGL